MRTIQWDGSNLDDDHAPELDKLDYEEERDRSSLFLVQGAGCETEDEPLGAPFHGQARGH